MKKITQPRPPVPEEYIFTEEIDYFALGQDSLWGHGDKETLEFLETANLSGDWLDLAAGDGRYAPPLLKQVKQLVAADIDGGALSKLWFRSSKEFQHKLRLIAFDMTRGFPLKDRAFDGVFCTGILHLFPEHVLSEIANEIDRVVKPGGRIVLDFGTDIERRFLDGRRFYLPREPRYTLKSASELLRRLFKKYEVQTLESTFEDDLTTIPKHGHITRGNFILLVAHKPC